jgi:ASPIC and UnbV
VSGGYSSHDYLRVHFGLGQATKAGNIEIRWPSGQVDIPENVPPASRFLRGLAPPIANTRQLV